VASNSSISGATGPPGHPSALNLARVYRQIAQADYLSSDEVKRFLKLSPDLYSRDNLRRATRRLDELKNLARDVVHPLTRNFLELGDATSGAVFTYPTCVRVLEHEWPWTE